ncbi:hypothetical protein N6H14_07580 [Paenibacillus sp. CC-CFT747]|nr:hypothetical protein N6H14_07580 [Paenibacillus sp. CC-CFT747]
MGYVALVGSICLLLAVACADRKASDTNKKLDEYAWQITSDIKQMAPSASWSLSKDEENGKVRVGIAELSDSQKNELQEKYGEWLEIKPGPIPVPAPNQSRTSEEANLH